MPTLKEIARQQARALNRAAAQQPRQQESKKQEREHIARLKEQNERS